MSRTLLLITPGFIARGDFDAQGRLIAVAQAVPQANVTDVASLALAALALLKTPPRRVWALTTAAVTAVIESAPGRLQGLDESELASALAYEAEALTGLPAMSSQTAARRLPSLHAGSESWWVTQMSQRMRSEIESEVTQRGARLEGVAHPGGLLPQQDAGREGFELWQDLLFMRRSQGFDILPVDEAAPLESLMARFPAAPGQPPRWVLTTRQATALDGVECLSLHDESILRDWLLACHETLTSPTPAVPVLLSPVPPMSGTKRAWLSVAAAVLVLSLCAGHWWLTERQLHSAQAEIKTLTTLARQRDELQAAAAEANKVRAELEAARQHQAQALRGFGAMLSAVAELRPSGLLVRALKEPSGAGSGGGTHAASTEAVISGLCVQQSLAAEFSNVLAAQLAPHGWSVRPARTTARLAGTTPMWDFEIPLRLDGGSRPPGTTQAAAKP